MEQISYNGPIFKIREYTQENEFEQQVISQAREIFMPNALYIDIN